MEKRVLADSSRAPSPQESTARRRCHWNRIKKKRSSQDFGRKCCGIQKKHVHLRLKLQLSSMRRKIFNTLLATLVCTLALQAKGPQNSGERIYIYGCAASFLDSVVYITDIQPVDSAVLSKKTGFQIGRAHV